MSFQGLLDKKWIQNMVCQHEAHPHIAAVGGETLPPLNNLKIVASQYISNSGIQFKLNGSMETLYFPTCNVSIKKNILEKYLFDVEFPYAGGEDLEYFWRLYKNNYRFIYNKNIIVHHYRTSSFRAFLRQQYTYGRGNMLVYFRHKDHPILKKYLTMNGLLLFFKTLNCFFNIFAFIGWYFFAEHIMNIYHIKGKRKKFKMYILLLLHRICNILGNIREVMDIKRRIYE